MLGTYVGVLGAVVHQHDSTVAGLVVPWGLVVALAPLVPLARVADRTDTLGSAAFLIGWGLALVLQGSASGGDYLVGSDVIGWTYAGAGLVLVVTPVLVNSRMTR